MEKAAKPLLYPCSEKYISVTRPNSVAPMVAIARYSFNVLPASKNEL